MLKSACVYGKQNRLTCKASILKIQGHDRIACIGWVLADWPPDPQPLPRAISPPRSQPNVPCLIGREPPPGSLVGGWWTRGKALRRVALWVGGAGSRSSHREAPCHTQRPSPASGWTSLAHSWRQCHPNSNLVREDQVSSWSRRKKRGMRWKILWCRIQVKAMWTRPKWRIQFPARKW